MIPSNLEIWERWTLEEKQIEEKYTLYINFYDINYNNNSFQSFLKVFNLNLNFIFAVGTIEKPDIRENRDNILIIAYDNRGNGKPGFKVGVEGNMGDLP